MHNTQPAGRHALAVLALAAAIALPGAARAGLSSEGGGDHSVVPLYRALTFGAIDRGGNGSYNSNDFLGVDYQSNLAPQSLATAHGAVGANGASMAVNRWAAWSDFHAARTLASMTVNNANASDTHYLVAGQGSATSVRFFRPEAAASRATLTFRLSGTKTNPCGLGQSAGRIDFAATADPTKNWLNLFDGGVASLFEYGAGTPYTLSFQACTAVQSGRTGDGNLRVQLAGPACELFDTTCDTAVASSAAHAWKAIDVNFVATGSSTTVSFPNTQNSCTRFTFIDGASVTAVPEPAGVVLMLARLAAVGLRAQRSRHAGGAPR